MQEVLSALLGRKNIVITEIPYTCAGNKTKLVESLVALMKDKVFDEIYDVRDESSSDVPTAERILILPSPVV